MKIQSITNVLSIHESLTSLTHQPFIFSNMKRASGGGHLENFKIQMHFQDGRRQKRVSYLKIWMVHAMFHGLSLSRHIRDERFS